MKKCVSCHAEYDDDIKFCPQCGGELQSDKTTCTACGAELPDDAKFCPKCGAKRVDPNVCPACGAELSEDDKFCPKCGARRGGAAVPQNNDAAAPKKSKKPIGASFAAAKNKVLTFENNHSVIVNALVIMLAVVVLFVSLFAPIKMAAPDLSGIMSGIISTSSKYDMDTVTVDQSIYQVLGAWGYAGYDSDDEKFKAETSKKFQDDLKDYNENVENTYNNWVKRHPETNSDQRDQKKFELAFEYMSDIDIFSLMLITMYEAAAEPDSWNEKDYIYTALAEIYTALAFATIVSLIHIALAIISLVFIVLAIIGIVRKRQSPAQKFIKSSIILSGVALLLLSIAPSLVSLGAMLAVCLTSALVYFAYGIVGGIAKDKNVLHIVKRSVCAALSVVAFFLLCGYILSFKTVSSVFGSDETSTVSMSAPLGTTVSTVITITKLISISSSLKYVYSELSAVTAIFALILFVAGAAVMFTSMLLELDKLANDVERTDKLRVLPLVGAIILVVAALLIGIMSAVIEIPDSDLTSTGVFYIGMAYKFFAGAQVYVSLAFAVASVIFGALFCPKPKRVEVSA